MIFVILLKTFVVKEKHHISWIIVFPQKKKKSIKWESSPRTLVLSTNHCVSPFSWAAVKQSLAHLTPLSSFSFSAQNALLFILKCSRPEHRMLTYKLREGLSNIFSNIICQDDNFSSYPYTKISLNLIKPSK